MTVIEHERIDAGKDNAPRVMHVRIGPVNNALCGKPWKGREVYTLETAPPHQPCVVCFSLAGLS